MATAISLVVASGIGLTNAHADNKRLSQLSFDKPVSREAQKEASNIRKASQEKGGYTYRFMTERRSARPMLAREKRVAQKDISVHTIDKAAPVVTAQADAQNPSSGPVAVEVSAERAPTLIYNQSQYLDHLPSVLNTDTPKEAVQPWEVLRNRTIVSGEVKPTKKKETSSPAIRTPLR